MTFDRALGSRVIDGWDGGVGGGEERWLMAERENPGRGATAAG